MLETHVCFRNSRPTGTFDGYNSLSTRHPPLFSTLEYWTNGSATHLMSSPTTTDAVSAPEAVFRNYEYTVPMPIRRSTTKSVSAARTPVTQESNIVRNSVLAGSIAGIATSFAFYPFEMLRTKMQSAAAHETSTTTVSSRGSSAKSLSRASLSATTRHRGPVKVFFHTIQHGGIRALYTGLALPLSAQAVYKATVFSVNKVATNALTEFKTQERRKVGDFAPVTLTKMDRFWCGFLGGAINAAVFVTPVEFVRNQLIAQHTRASHGIRSDIYFKGPRHVITHTVSTQGVLGLWKGCSMAVTRDALGCGCFFFTFNYLSQRLPQDKTSSTLVAGAFSGLAFWLAALPLDTVKTWVQNGSATSGTSAVVESVSEHGIVFTARRLCRGYQVALGRGMPAAAVTCTTYDSVYRYLQKYM